MSENTETTDLKDRLRTLEGEMTEVRSRLARLESRLAEKEASAGPARRVSPAAADPIAQPAPDDSEMIAAAPKVPAPSVPHPLAPPRASEPPAPEPTSLAGPAPEPVHPASEPKEPSSLHRLLDALHLLPPAQGSGEVHLVAWWTTRIGMLLAVLGVVFFGVYVSINTPPWVKLTELGIVSVVIAALGTRLEARLPKFGSVLLGGGLSLLYFTALAAYAVPAVKVTDDLMLAAGLQLGALGLLFGTALRRGSPTVATMATLFGFVSAFLSLEVGFDDFALIGALGLTVIGVFLRRWRGWAVPLGVSAVLQYTVHVTLAFTVWQSGIGTRDPAFAFGIVGLGFLLVFLSAVIEGPMVDGRMARGQRWIQSINAPVAVLAGFLVAAVVLPDGNLSRYFFGSAVVALASAFWMWRLAPADSLFSMFAVKAAALAGLGICTEWGDRTRWIALCIEAFVILAAARRTRKPVLLWIAGLAWLLSLAFFFDDTGKLPEQMASWGGPLTAAYVLASPLLFIAIARSWPGETGKAPDLVPVLLTVPALLPALGASGLFVDLAWGPLALLGLSSGLVLLARALRSLVPLPAAAILLAYAHGAIHSFDPTNHGLLWLWLGAGSVGLATACGGWLCAEVVAKTHEKWGGSLITLGTGLMAAGLVLVSAGFFHTWPIPIAAGLTALVAALVTWTGVGTRRLSLVGSGVLLLAATVALAWYRWLESAPGPGMEFWYWKAALGALLVFAGLIHPGPVRHELEFQLRFREACSVAAVTCLILTWTVIDQTLGPAWAPWVTVALGFVYLGLGFARQSAIGMTVASALSMLMMATIAGDRQWPPEAGPWVALAGAVATGLALAAYPALTDRRWPWSGRRLRSIWMGVHAGGALLFILTIAVTAGAPWMDVASVLWALGGIAVFFLGLFFRSRPHRIFGLMALAACIARVFLVDINSTLYRIAAFIVLGAVLLWVGFSYERFRHLIEGDEEEEL